METIGKDSQVGMPFIGTVKPPFTMPPDVSERISDTGAIRYAVQMSGHDDYEIADLLGISHGYMSKVLKGTAGLHGKRLVKFMRLTNSIAPLQWLAAQMGCSIEVIDRRAMEIAALRARIAEMERVA